MGERPILFSDPLVRAILDGRKTEARRVVKPQPPTVEAVRAACGARFKLYRPRPGRNWNISGPVLDVRRLMADDDGALGPHTWSCPYGEPDDVLWVREAWAALRPGQWDDVDGPPSRMDPGRVSVEYRSTDPLAGWPSDVRGYRYRPSIYMPRWAARIFLRVTEVRVERVQDIDDAGAKAEGVDGGREAFAALWDDINGKRGFGWETNPWVWVVRFERTEAP